MIEIARALADAVLYEGFLLFPYAKSALKNQMPFQFGVVMPQGYADPSEPAELRTQVVVCAGEEIDGLLRFLEIAGDPVEREVAFSLRLSDSPASIPFAVGVLNGEIAIEAQRVNGVTRIAITVRNGTVTSERATRNEALRGALVSAHLLLEARGGEFASLLDPPQEAAAAAAACVNQRLFPVLVGEGSEGRRTSPMLLCSPIILYDFPKIAAASRARTFEATEIDELLMLSVASLTDDEKRDARAAHPYVRELVERAEELDAGTQRTLHGEVTIAGVPLRPGSRVRVVPKGRADVWDDIVRGMTARVTAVHTDFEGKQYVGVLFDADPASDMHEWYGRSFFYGVDEVEPLP